VLIAVPDHSHAVLTAAALHAGKHVYCEKPLTRTIREARAIVDLAAKTGLVTQMGIQIHSFDNYRRVVEIIQSGAIGQVAEVQIWNNRHNPPADTTVIDPVPTTFNYDLWLGPMAMRPLLKGYHPYNWRRFWPFGSALLGDIGCHLMDPAFWALDLKYPSKITCSSSPMSGEITPEWTMAHFEFPARGEKPPVKLSWYDPPNKPEDFEALAPQLSDKLKGEGILFIGENGMLCTDYTEHRLLPQEKFKDFKAPTTRLAHSPGHQLEWVNACLKNDPSAASAPFAYGALLTETVMLGTIALRTGKTLEWDAEKMKFRDCPEADAMLGYDYRPGWTL
jgi:predicted dehydrogenase